MNIELLIQSKTDVDSERHLVNSFAHHCLFISKSLTYSNTGPLKFINETKTFQQYLAIIQKLS